MGRPTWFILLIISLSVTCVVAETSTEIVCDVGCRCDGILTANCSQSFHKTIPTTLSPHLKYLNLSSNNLVPDSLRGLSSRFPNLVVLNLANNYISNISDGVFVGFDNIEELNIAHNNIQKLTPGTFRGLINLKRLDLTGNDLITIERMSFSVVPALTHLNGLTIENLADGVFRGLHNLIHLDITITKRGKQPIPLSLPAVDCLQLKLPNLKQFHQTNKLGIIGPVRSRLKRLTITAPNLNSLPMDLIQNIEHLETFSLRVNNMSSINRYFFNNIASDIGTIRLQTIILNGVNRIYSHMFAFLSNLQRLVINNSSRIPYDLNIGAQTLNHLDLSDSSIDKLGHTWCSSSANYFNISFNDVTNIGRYALARCRALETLDLSYNKIASIDNAAFKTFIHNLKYLNLSHNFLKKLPLDLLSDATQLQTLHLHDNKLMAIEPGFFDGPTNLVHLTLYGNELCCFNISTFTNLNHLKHLDLSHNYISELHSGIFKHMYELVYLDLSDNLFRNMPTDFLPYKPESDPLQLYIQNRNLYCSCSLLDTIMADGIRIYGQCKKTYEADGIVSTSSFFIKQSYINEICPGWKNTKTTPSIRFNAPTTLSMNPPTTKPLNVDKDIDHDHDTPFGNKSRDIWEHIKRNSASDYAHVHNNSSVLFPTKGNDSSRYWIGIRDILTITAISFVVLVHIIVLIYVVHLRLRGSLYMRSYIVNDK